MKHSCWHFSALDTWFFRESRPMESIGGSELGSRFPPPVSTVAGAVRRIIAESSYQMDWKRFREGEEYTALRALIGDGDCLGSLRFRGPWIIRKRKPDQWERLYPVPFNLVGVAEAGQLTGLVQLEVGEPRWCDLGRQVRLARTAEGIRGVFALQDYWMTEAQLRKVLEGKPITNPGELIETRDLYQQESRLGIARDPHKRTVLKSLLYQTRHIRPKPDVGVEIEVFSEQEITGLPARGIARLGGEGRASGWAVRECEASVNPVPGLHIKPDDNIRGIILVLLSSASIEPLAGQRYTPLPGFKKEEKETTRWSGEIHGIALTLHCAMTGKAIREGGWDMANHKPRPVRSLIPAGSVFYCTVDNGDIEQAIRTLHNTQLPGNSNDIALGRGLLAAGLWRNQQINNGDQQS